MRTRSLAWPNMAERGSIPDFCSISGIERFILPDLACRRRMMASHLAPQRTEPLWGAEPLLGGRARAPRTFATSAQYALCQITARGRGAVAFRARTRRYLQPGLGCLRRNRREVFAAAMTRYL